MPKASLEQDANGAVPVLDVSPAWLDVFDGRLHPDVLRTASCRIPSFLTPFCPELLSLGGGWSVVGCYHLAMMGQELTITTPNSKVRYQCSFIACWWEKHKLTTDQFDVEKRCSIQNVSAEKSYLTEAQTVPLQGCVSLPLGYTPPDAGDCKYCNI